MDKSEKDLIAFVEAKAKNMTLAEFKKIQQENWYLAMAFCNKLKVDKGDFFISNYGNHIGYFKTEEEAITYGSEVLGQFDEDFMVYKSE